MAHDLSDILLRVQAEQPVTREEATAVVRAVVRTCKGPIKKGKAAEYAELRRQAGHFGGADRADIGVLDTLNREGCGADFNDVICKHPFDGKERLVKCPNCGQKITYTAPRFVLKD